MPAQVLSWNINGLRSFKTDMKEFLTGLQADIICLQETKVTRDMLEEPLAIVEGYSSYYSFSRKRSGYSGVATFCSQQATPTSAQEGLSGLFVGELNNGSGRPDALPVEWREEELKDLDSEGRTIITQHVLKDKSGAEKEVTIINVYCPRVDPEKPERRKFKLRFYELLRQRAAVIHASGSHVVILGDINCSHKRIDHCDPDESEVFENRLERKYLDKFVIPLHKTEGNVTTCHSSSLHDLGATNRLSSTCINTNGSHRDGDSVSSEKVCSINSDHLEEIVSGDIDSVNDGGLEKSYKSIKKDEENSEMMQKTSEAGPQEKDELEDDLLTSSTEFQVVDTFRYFHPQKREAFTCWNVFTNCRSTNYGTRIDYIFCDEEFLPHVTDSLIQQEVMGSDHCPVVVIIEEAFVPAPQLPPSCTKFFPEFRGQQQKLSSYFQPKSTIENQVKPSAQNFQPHLGAGSFTKKLTQNLTKRKVSSSKTKILTNKKQCAEKQSSLSSFFTLKTGNQQPSEKLLNFEDNNCKGENSSKCCDESNPTESLNCMLSLRQSTSGSDQGSNTYSSTLSNSENVSENNMKSSVKSSQIKNEGWGFLMKGPKPAPLCPGHGEPSVMLTVKKKGPNLNRQFYACARGVGKEGDPNARCNFFKWVNKK